MICSNQERINTFGNNNGSFFPISHALMFCLSWFLVKVLYCSEFDYSINLFDVKTVSQFCQGSVSVSMSIYQTLFCFLCTHLTAGEKECDELKRNADVHEIHRRTHFHSFSGIGLPKSIHDHE